MQPTHVQLASDGGLHRDGGTPSVDRSYQLGYSGFIYASRQLERGFTLRHLGVVLITADHSPFVVCQRGEPEILANAVAVAPMVARRLSAVGRPLLSFNVFPSNKTFGSFLGIRKTGIVILERSPFAHLDAKLGQLVDSDAELDVADAVFAEVAELASRQLPPPSRENPRAAELRKLLETDPEAPIGQLASHFGLTPRTFARLFSSSVGMSIRDYRDFVRGRQLVGPLQSELPLTEVALNVGFGGSPQLSHAFRKWFGQSPSSMRDRRIVHMQMSSAPDQA